MTKEEHNKIIDFVNSDDYVLLNSYISKPYEETIIEQDKEIERLNKIIEVKTNRIQQLMKRLAKRQEKVDRLNNIINEATDKAKTMKVSMLLDVVDGIDIDSQFVHALFELIDFLEKKELKEGK